LSKDSINQTKNQAFIDGLDYLYPMFSRLKHFLGIESVKIKLLIPENQPTPGVIIGKVAFHSMSTQKVTSLTITLLEQYTKGRKKKKEKQTFELGTITLERPFDVPAGKTIKIAFKLHYTKVHSEMDQLADSNVIMKGVSKAAKMVGNIRSEYELIAEADVKGAGLNPFDKVTLVI